jgi:hypothetical protein
MDTPETVDVWKHTLDLLMLMQLPKPSGSAGEAVHERCKLSGFATFGNRRPRLVRGVHLHIVEKYSNSTIAVCWRDATSGCYGEQLWRVVTARAGSTCALSGLQIRRGDAVFRPSTRGHKPANNDSMILASAVEVTIRNSGSDLPAW